MSTRNRSERENYKLVLSVAFQKNVETAGKGQIFPEDKEENEGALKVQAEGAVSLRKG